jgi:phosphatidylserine/phosphatidylglycerophosphate/cardiolipin synthase-like enzyme
MDSPQSRLPLLLSFLLIVCVACSSPSPYISASPDGTPSIEVFFSSIGGATEAVVRELSDAKQEILVQAYSFTSAPIAKALVDAHKRG